jgi:hypothetical protein
MGAEGYEGLVWGGTFVDGFRPLGAGSEETAQYKLRLRLMILSQAYPILSDYRLCESKHP